jgi:hypothetical protein
LKCQGFLKKERSKIMFTIIKLLPEEAGFHSIESQSHRTEVWMDGYIEVPESLLEAVMESGGWCNLVLDGNGRLTGIVPLEQPAPKPFEPEPEFALPTAAEAIFDDFEQRLAQLETQQMQYQGLLAISLEQNEARGAAI